MMLLQFALYQQVELLIDPPESDVGFHGYEIVALHEGVEKLVDRDRLAHGVALAETVALQHPGNGPGRREPDHAGRTELVGPSGIEQHFRWSDELGEIGRAHV